jgi:hypothetical protein
MRIVCSICALLLKHNARLSSDASSSNTHTPQIVGARRPIVLQNLEAGAAFRNDWLDGKRVPLLHHPYTSCADEINPTPPPTNTSQHTWKGVGRVQNVRQHVEVVEDSVTRKLIDNVELAVLLHCLVHGASWSIIQHEWDEVETT